MSPGPALRSIPLIPKYFGSAKFDPRFQRDSVSGVARPRATQSTDLVEFRAGTKPAPAPDGRHRDAVEFSYRVLVNKALLGRHVLLVGDATNEADVARLMNGAAADLVFIDPPYNCDYQGYTEEHLTIQGDRMSGAEFKQFLEAAFLSCRTRPWSSTISSPLPRNTGAALWAKVVRVWKSNTDRSAKLS
jgi:hypothetical protein